MNRLSDVFRVQEATRNLKEIFGAPDGFENELRIRLRRIGNVVAKTPSPRNDPSIQTLYSPNTPLGDAEQEFLQLKDWLRRIYSFEDFN